MSDFAYLEFTYTFLSFFRVWLESMKNVLKMHLSTVKRARDHMGPRVPYVTFMSYFGSKCLLLCKAALFANWQKSQKMTFLTLWWSFENSASDFDIKMIKIVIFINKWVLSRHWDLGVWDTLGYYIVHIKWHKFIWNLHWQKKHEKSDFPVFSCFLSKIARL